MDTAAQPAGERADLLGTLALHRGFLRQTTRGLTDEQARQRTTVSELCLAGIIKHVALTERRWIEFIGRGGEALSGGLEEHVVSFTAGPSEPLAGLLEEYERVAATTEAVVGQLPDLAASQALPPAPWFPPGARWSARRVLLHVLAETSQHAGHADIIREALDGAKTMG